MKVLLALCLALSAAAAVSAHHGYEGHDHCPEGWTEWNGHCYRFFNQPRKNFDASEDYCNDQETENSCACESAHLVKVDSQAENDFLHEWWQSLREPTSSSTRQHVRIGLSDGSSEGNWKWIADNSALGAYKNWEGGQPDNAGGNQDCVVMWKTGSGSGDRGKWDDEGCTQARAYFCEFTL